MTTTPCPRVTDAGPCKNTQPHTGDGRGCVHHSTSGVPDRHEKGDDE